MYPALFILLRYTLYMQSVRKCFVLSGSTYLVLFIVSELQRLGALEAAAKASSKGKWNKDTAKVSL